MEKFIVSARKYRPATFKSVVGQAHITTTLQNAIERNQLAHAYLFCGPRGVGKTTCARIFAKAINCENSDHAEACNHCESCNAFNEGRSLNIHELDAASNNSVEDIRELIDQVYIAPLNGKYSVFIIDEVHMLSSQAFNAFLKTLEEPPQHAIFILCTTEKHKIIPTILSRCQTYDFNRIHVEDAVSYLKYVASSENIETDEESLNLIAQKADGGMRDALSMFDKAVSFCGAKLEYHSVAKTLNVLDYDIYFNIVDTLNQGDYVNALKMYDSILNNGFSTQTFLTGLNQHLRDLLVAKGPAISLIDYSKSLLERYQKQGAECSEGFLFNAISLLTDTDAKLKGSSNSRLLAELTLMKISTLGQKKNNFEIAVSPQIKLPDLSAAPITASAPKPVQPSQVQTPVQTVPVTPSDASQTKGQMPHITSVQETKAEVAAKVSTTPISKPIQDIPDPKPISHSAPIGDVANIKVESLSSLLGDMNKPEEVSKEHAVDPRAEEKLQAAKEKIIEYVESTRPRLRQSFIDMQISGNAISVCVLSNILKADIDETRSEFLEHLKKLSGVTGPIELNIEVSNKEVKLRPIKLEDRLNHIRSVTPEFDNLKNLLDLDVE